MRNQSNRSLKCLPEWVDIPFEEIEYRCVKHPNDHPARKGKDFKKGRFASTPSPVEIVARYRCPKGERLWPYCPQDGYRFFPTGKLNLFGIVGTPYSGKSTIMAAEFTTLVEPYIAWYQWGVEITQDKAKEQFERRILNYYRRRIPIPKTPPQEPPLLVPIRITPRGRGWLRSTTDIILHDKAGEIWLDFERLLEEMPFLIEAKGVLFLLDPYSIPALRQILPSEQYILGADFAPDRDPELDTAVEIALLNQKNLFAWEGSRNKRFAVVISKADVIWEFARELFASPDDLQLLRKANRHENRVDQVALREISQICRDFLTDRVGMEPFVTNVEAAFQEVGYFMVQSWKQRNGVILEGAIAVEDPLFWLLSRCS